MIKRLIKVILLLIFTVMIQQQAVSTNRDLLRLIQVNQEFGYNYVSEKLSHPVAWLMSR